MSRPLRVVVQVPGEPHVYEAVAREPLPVSLPVVAERVQAVTALAPAQGRLGQVVELEPVA